MKAETRSSRHLHVCHLTHTFSLPPIVPPSSYVSLAHGTHICASREQQRFRELEMRYLLGVLWPV